MRKRILLAGLFHETHSFVGTTTGLDEFTIRKGDDLLGRRGDGSTVDGFLEIAEKEDWEIVPVAEYTALPSGTVEHAVFEQFGAELEQGLRQALANGGLDGIWLALHGAMVTTESVDPEGDLLARLRQVPGAEVLPLFAVFDLHANFTTKMAQHASGLVAYRKNPHSDARDEAMRSARLLARTFEQNVSPRTYARNAPVIWAPTGTGTADRPMRDLEALARQIETESPGISVANVIGGYSFSDVPDAGVAFSVVTTGSEAEAEAALDRLEQLAIDLRELGRPEEWDLDAALTEIKGKSGGPYLVVEPSDNIGGGAPGDDTAVLRGFLRHGIRNAVVAIADPTAVRAFAGAEPGDRLKCSVGGRGSALGAGPLEVEAEFISRSDGKFMLEDRRSHTVASQGIHYDMGPSAVVRVEGVTVLLTSRKAAPADLAQYRSQGIVPEDQFAIGIKAAVSHRQAYDPIKAGSYTVRTPGPCTSAIETLPYTRLRPSVFPISH